MKAVIPELEAPVIIVAADQQAEGYVPITAALVRHPAYAAKGKHNTNVLAFRPNVEERLRIAAGADIYVSLLTFGGPMQGIIVMAGRDEASAIYNVRAGRRMEYKGFTARVEFDSDACIYHGEVDSLRDAITFEAPTADRLSRAFRASVEDYLAMCSERGEAPEQPAKIGAENVPETSLTPPNTNAPGGER